MSAACGKDSRGRWRMTVANGNQRQPFFVLAFEHDTPAGERFRLSRPARCCMELRNAVATAVYRCSFAASVKSGILLPASDNLRVMAKVIQGDCA